jgi:F420-non-reducing hydrogenase large subunit
VLAGGVAKGLKPEELEQISPGSTSSTTSTSSRWQLFRDVVLANEAYVDLIVNGPYTLDVHNMGLVDENNAPNFYHGKVRVVATRAMRSGKYEQHEYASYVAEHIEPWSYLKFPTSSSVAGRGTWRAIDSSLYCATPLHVSTSPTAWRRPGAGGLRGDDVVIGHPSKLLLGNHWARLVEMVQNAEMLKQYCADPEITGDSSAVIPQQITGEGFGIVEAMARYADAPLHLRRHNHLHERQPDRRHDQQQRAPSRWSPEGRPDAHPARQGPTRHPPHGGDGVSGVRPLLQLLRYAQPTRRDAAADQYL